MKNRILFLYLLLSTGLSLSAQETFTYANLDRDFFDGKELFAQRKYSASVVFFEKFLEDRKNTDAERIQEANYYLACDAYELRKTYAETLLQAYVDAYPYTQFEDRVYYMMGNLAFEQKKYNMALMYYEKSNEKNLSDIESAEISFNKGYAYIEAGEFGKAMPYFKSLKGKKTKYEFSAAYYYSYAQYSLKNYDAALDGFLAIEDQPEFKPFVPYYIIQIYYYNKDYEKLMPYAEQVLQTNLTNPNNVEVYRILGECAFQKNQYKKTISYLNKYVKGAPKVMRNDMYILGVSNYRIGEFDEAAKYLAKVTTVKDSLSQNAYYHLGHSYVELNKKTNARMAFKSAAEMDFDQKVKEESAFNYILTTFETTSPFGESIKVFEDFIADFPESKYIETVKENLVTAYMSSKNYAAASASLAKLKSLSPAMKDVQAYIQFQLGTEEYVKGEYVRANELFTTALDQGSPSFNVAQVYYWRGDSHYRLNNYEEARADYKEFLASKNASKYPDYNLVNYGIGYTYFQQKQYKTALPLFLKYVENEKELSVPNYADALDRLGDCYFITRDLANAEKYYTKSVTANGKNADYSIFQKAFVQGLRKNYKGKIDGLQKLIGTYPRSDYEDDAYYELGRAYVMIDQQDKAITTNLTLINKFPQSPLARKAALEIGMLYYNAGKYDDAIEAYKEVVTNYPNSEEMRTALESMEAIYVEMNNVSEYFAYSKGKGFVETDPAKEDSLTYLAAERLYMKSNFLAAAPALEKYIENFCPSGRSCITARYYLADCYFTTNKMLKAMEQYKALSQLEGNSYMENVLVRLSQIAYEEKEYATALESFKKLRDIAQDPENINASKIGVLRCSYLLNDAQSTLGIAKEILTMKGLTPDLEKEARFHQAKANIQVGDKDKAQADLRFLAKDTRSAAGAESKYLVADYLFVSGKDVKAEEEISDFIAKGTPHQYWLARAFVLLADIYIKRGDDFQAKQYLLSLQSNYKTADSIQDLILERLDAIQSREANAIVE